MLIEKNGGLPESGFGWGVRKIKYQKAKRKKWGEFAFRKGERLPRRFAPRNDGVARERTTGAGWGVRK